MYGCFDGVIVYGFLEENNCAVLSSEWLDKHFPRVEIYASGVVRCYCSTAIYGISCTLNVETGVVELDQEDKKEIEAFFALYKSQNSTCKPSLGFHTAVVGDYEFCNTDRVYTLQDDK